VLVPERWRHRAGRGAAVSGGCQHVKSVPCPQTLARRASPCQPYGAVGVGLQVVRSLKAWGQVST
jgi:hypothetical protein